MLGYAINLSELDTLAGVTDPNPATVDVFTDSGSLFHVGAGVALSFLPAPWGIAAFSAFCAYELSKGDTGETWSRTGGKFAELGLGVVAGKLGANALGKRRSN